jgi:hypothetical protein
MMFKLLPIVTLVAVSAFAVAPVDEAIIAQPGENRSALSDSTFSRVGNATALTNDLVAEMCNTYWPGGSKVLFQCDVGGLKTNLYTAPTNGSKIKTNISPGNDTYYYPDVDNTGSNVCYATGDDNNDYFEIAVMTVPGGVETVITSNEATYGLDSLFPRYKGSGNKIAHVQRDWGTNTDRIVTTNTDGSNETIICTLRSGANELISSMDWLGNTNYVIYTNYYGDLYKVTTSAGSSPTQIGTHSDYHRAQSNAAGTEILSAETWSSSRQRYVTMNPDGSGRKTIVRPDYFPDFADIFCQPCFTAAGDGVIALATPVSNPTYFDIFLIDETEYCGVESVSLGTLKASFK